MRTFSLVGLLTCGVMMTVGAACASSPRQRPVEMGPVQTGEGSLEAERRELEGSWTLTSARIYDSTGGSREVQASGLLTYDAFGNMTVQGSVVDEQTKTTIPLDFTGRVVIDPANHQFHSADVVGFDPASNPALAPVSLDKVRRYQVTSDTLTVTYLDAAGRPTAVVTWRKART
jgi:hypothetical protein